MAYTTQQLISILDREMQAGWQGDRVLLSAKERFNDPVLSLVLGHDKISKVYAYREFREQIHHYQHQYKVSGLIWRTCRFKEESISYPELHNQLAAIPEDKEILQGSKESVLQFWRRHSQNLKLWLLGKEQQRMTREMVEELAKEAEWAEMDTTLNELYIGLCWGNPQECRYQWAMPESGCRRIAAVPNEPSAIKI
ncbi:hypothetical protein [Spirulina sp. 06S082]|uniref:hypothetical protein n=1 Tax=Spirulina sp. 06S082 TaxID=3110248 RepID=UPI002B21F92A|nr:hypothetical protein [Spirulina sp. 06S082]MEA5472161.1 hypothetical protein [Spirulina sp. 06S082]